MDECHVNPSACKYKSIDDLKVHPETSNIDPCRNEGNIWRGWRVTPNNNKNKPTIVKIVPFYKDDFKTIHPHFYHVAPFVSGYKCVQHCAKVVVGVGVYKFDLNIKCIYHQTTGSTIYRSWLYIRTWFTNHIPCHVLQYGWSFRL